MSYKELYLQLFAALTDALSALQCGKIVQGIQILLHATRAVEAAHMKKDILPRTPPE